MSNYDTEDGARLFYRVQGKDAGQPPLIMVHGWCSNLTHWDPVVKHFGRRHRILRIDRRGMGRSTTTGSGHTAEQHAADISEIAKLEGFRGAVVIGHAGGGPTTLELTRGYARLVKATVMIDSGMYPLPRLGNAKSAFGAVLGGMIDALSGPDGRRAFRKMYSGYFGPKCDRAVSRQAVSEAAKTPLPVAIDELHGMAVSTEKMADDIRKPVLWLTAAGVDQDYVRKHLANVQFAEVVGSGHFPQLEVPAQTNAMIETFIAQL